MALEPNRPLFGVAFETSLLEDVAFEPNRRTDDVLDVLLLGFTPLEPEKIPTVDEGLVDPNKLLLEGGWVDALLPEGAEFEPNRLPSGDSVLFSDPSVDDPNVHLLLLGTLLVTEKPELAKIEAIDSFLASLVPAGIVGCAKGFTAQVCVVNSSSRFLLFVSGSR